MGFWGNLANEAGKKTGKAIGNKLFGKYGADQTINVGGTTNTQESFMGMASSIMESMKSGELQLKQYENVEAIKRELRDVEFDTENTQNNYSMLLKLLPIIEAEMKQCYIHDGEVISEEGLYELALSKYNTWLDMLQVQDPLNSNLVIFQNKRRDWEAYWQAEKEKIKKSERKTTIFFVCFFILLAIGVAIGIIFG